MTDSEGYNVAKKRITDRCRELEGAVKRAQESLSMWQDELRAETDLLVAFEQMQKTIAQT